MELTALLTRGLRLAALVTLVVAGSLVYSSIGQAKDSLAPKTAGDRWLPCERWVMYHWNPIDMPRFYKLTGITQLELYDWMRDDDNRNFGGLLTKRGFDPESVVEQTLAVTPKTRVGARRVLRARAVRLLSQGHLAQHVFFHWFHNPAIRQNAREIYGMSSWDYAKARRLGFSPADIGELHNGFTREQTAARIVRVMKRYEWRGLRGGATSRSQAEHYLESITELADEWLDQRYHKPKPKGGLPKPTKRHGSRASKATCRDFVGAGQARDGFTREQLRAHPVRMSGTDHGLPGFCPLAEATRRQIATAE